MYVVTHEYTFTDGATSRMYDARLEFVGDNDQLVDGMLPCDEALCGAWIVENLQGADLARRYGPQHATLERLAAILFHSLRSTCAPMISAVTLIDRGVARDAYALTSALELASRAGTRETATYRDGPAITSVSRLRAALRSVGIDPDARGVMEVLSSL